MIHQLDPRDFGKVSKLIKHTNHELSIAAVITGNTPGEIYVDHVEEPSSTLIMTPECNVVAGDSNNKKFNEGVKKLLDFYDPITCDTSDWEEKINDIHCNRALKKYKRRYYQFEELRFENYVASLDNQYTLEYVQVDTLDDIQYENSEKIKEWFVFKNRNEVKDYCLGAYIRQGNKIVCWCLVDCIVGDQIEIGIHTHKDFRRRGLGSIALAATVDSSMLNGVKEIGWHCVDTNVGSYTIAEKIGFKKGKEYLSFSPYPPIENVTDLTHEQWSEWAIHYEQMNKIEPKYYRQAARCWGLSNNMERSMLTINDLVALEPSVPVNDLLNYNEFASFQDKAEWKAFAKKIRSS
ncbi:GNAT family N-acetyltransferase [Shouchella patagoniensis]|uniref:GNAT family N-acetyltransferase n=1 Tax=Shouchella patagoniensis TaxID=228576 RepID=UPI000994A08E|nr:GNAT family N-acetyltransferase [Shouchella patagoniensis]